METFVHLGDDAAALDYVYFEVAIPDNIQVSRLTAKPRGWRAEPPGPASQRIGDRWLRANTTLLLEVPSVIIPTETNWVLNPEHRDADKLRILPARPFQFNSRLWK